MVRTLNPARRAALLDAALKLFVAGGVQGTSTAEIARQAGVAAGTLFLYFPTKQSLVDTLILEIGRAQAENIKAHLSPELPAREYFRQIWASSVGWFAAHPAEYACARQLREAGAVSPSVIEESNRFFDFYYTAIQKGLAEGCLKPAPLELIGSFLYHGIAAVTELVTTLPDAAQSESYIQAGFEIFWDGIRLSEGK